MTARLPVGVFFALFTVSGFAGLIYESIWSHYLKLFLGHAAYAQTLVLAIFMGGMALGAWLVSRFTHRITSLLLGYAIAEIGIGFLALVFHKLFGAATGWAFDSVIPALGGAGVDAFKWTLASLMILPASILLGTTFPLMSAGIMRLYPEAGGRVLSMLYFTNSFGAALGVLASGFFLIDRLGLPGTIFSAGVLNVVLGLVVWGMVKQMGLAVAAAPGAASAPRAGGFAAIMLLLAFSTGAASFIYEITWIRMLVLGLGASTHSFEVMLAAFILGMSLGAFWIRNRIGRLKNDAAWLAGLLIAKAVFAVYAMWIYGSTLDFVRWVIGATANTDAGYTLFMVCALLASMAVMLPTAICAGMALPLATYALTSRGYGEASIGRIYGANTAGCIVGAAFATHIGMEALGVKGLTGLGALLDVGVAVALIAVGVGLRRNRGLALAGGVFAAAAAALYFVPLDLLKMSSGVFRAGTFFDPRVTQVQYYRDGKTATISVVDNAGIRSVRTNGKPDAAIQLDAAQAATQDEATMMLAGAIALSLKPEARLAANIGFGSGITSHTLLGSPNLEQLDSIEIERTVLDAARLFHPHNRRAYEDPRSRFHVEDAKTFFASAGRRYDIIVSEPSNPWVSGVSTLFSDEFYGRLKRHLKDDGVFVQWVHAYEINVGLVASIFQALGKHFPDYALYTWGRGGDLLVVATPNGRLPRLTGKVFEFPVAADLARLGYRNLADLESLRLGGRRAMEPLFVFSGFPVNSDFYPIIDQRGPRARFKRESAEEIRRLRDAPQPFLAMVDGEVRLPVADIGELPLNRPLRRELAAAGAQAIAVFMDGGRAPSTLLPPELRVQLLAGRGLLHGCAGAGAEMTEAVAEVVRISAPYLAKEALEPVFERVRGSRCHAELDEPSRERLRMLQAINARDAASIALAADNLLRTLPPALERERGQTLMAAMAGYLASGRPAEARRVLDANIDRVAQIDRATVVMHLLVSHVLASRPPPGAENRQFRR